MSGTAEKTKIAPKNAFHQPRSSRAHHSARLGSSRFAPFFEIALGWATARHHRVITAQRRPACSPWQLRLHHSTSCQSALHETNGTARGAGCDRVRTEGLDISAKLVAVGIRNGRES